MKKQQFLYVPFLITLLVGLIGGGAILSTYQKITNSRRLSIDKRLEVVSPAQTLSAFQLHYVSEGGRFVRIPLKYCNPDQPDTSMTPYCGMDQTFLEIDLKEDHLPVDKIQSIVTNGNRTVLYAVDAGKRLSNGCVFPDLYLYDLEKHEARQLKNDASMWKCGAAASYLSSISPGGRYAFIVASGPTEAHGSWIYDLEKDQIDPELSQAHLVTVFASGTDTQTEDHYTLYIDACQNFDDTCQQEPMIKIRNNISGKVARMNSLEALLKKKGIALLHLQGMKYSLQDGSLSVWGDGLGTNVTISNFRSQVLALVN